MTGAEIMAAVGFGVMLFSFIAGAWWRMESVIKSARGDALSAVSLTAAKTDILAENLAALRLHVAETYVSKQGLREQTEQIMGAIKDVAGSLAHLNERIDRVIENGPPASARRKPAST